MTIRATRSGALAIGGTAGGMTALLTVAALILRQPQMLFAVALLVASTMFAVVWLLRPLSLTLAGDEVVFVNVRREQHLPRSQIARCQQAGAAWIFSDSDGAQLLVLQALRFSDADVVAFCNRAGISLSVPSQAPVDKLHRDVRGAKSNRAWGVILGVLLLGFIGAAVFAQVHSQDTLRRYQAAPACTQVSPDTSACRLQTQARVTSVTPHKSGTTLHVTLVASGGDYTVWLNGPTPSVGDMVDVEVWDGDVRMVNGQPSGNNPARDPNMHLEAAIAVMALFALIPIGMAAFGQYQLVVARGRLRVAAAAAAGIEGSVAQVHPDATAHGVNLPPCGILHQPKEQFFAHEDPKTIRLGAIILGVISAVVLAGLTAGAIYISLPVFTAIAVIGLAWVASQFVGGWREVRFGGVFADDLHVGKVTTDWIGRMQRKVFDRSSVLEVTIDALRMSVVGIDGSTLFTSGAITPTDMDRFAQFLGVRVVKEAPPLQTDGVATPPVQTPVRVLPLPVRRAAGVMQSLGLLFVGLGVLNLIRIPGTPADRRRILLVLLAALVVYGGILYGLGLLLARGWRHSRELAIFGGGAATAVFLGCWVVAIGNINPMAVGIIAILMLPLFGLIAFWLRKRSETRGNQT